MENPPKLESPDDIGAPTGAATKPWAESGAWGWYVGHGQIDIDRVLYELPRDGFRWFTLKAGDAGHLFNGGQYTRDLQERFDAAGVKLIPWFYCYGAQPEAEAAIILQVLADTGAPGAILDVEAEFRDANRAAKDNGRETPASIVCRILRDALGPDFPLAVAPLPVLEYHQDLDYSTWYDAGFDLHFQCYVNDLGSQYPLASLFDSYAAAGFSPERIFPVYGAYPGASFTPDEVAYADWHREVAARGYLGSSIYRYDTADLTAYLEALE